MATVTSSDAPTPKPPTKKKKKYISRACDFCKHRHLKCDGDHPCNQCVKRKFKECLYKTINKKRGPKGGSQQNRKRPTKRIKLDPSLEPVAPPLTTPNAMQQQQTQPQQQQQQAALQSPRPLLMAFPNDPVNSAAAATGQYPMMYSQFPSAYDSPSPMFVSPSPLPMYDLERSLWQATTDTNQGDQNLFNPSPVPQGYSPFSTPFANNPAFGDSLGLTPSPLPLALASPVRSNNPVTGGNIAIAAVIAFAERVSPWVPNHFVLQGAEADNAWKVLMVDGLPTLPPEKFVNLFIYCVVFSHGCHQMNYTSVGSDFDTKAEQLAQLLFFSPTYIGAALRVKEMAEGADSLISALIMFALLRIQANDITGARLYINQAYNLLNLHHEKVSPRVAHRLYAHMAGMSSKAADTFHWVDNARSLGLLARTPENQVTLCLLLCSPCLLRDPYNRLIPSTISSQFSDINSQEGKLYTRMLEELDVAETLILSQESLNNIEEKGKETLLLRASFVAAFKLVIASCRALVFFQINDRTQATFYVTQVLMYAQTLFDDQTGQSRLDNAGSSFCWIPFALSYCGLVAKELGDRPRVSKVLEYLNLYISVYSLTSMLIDPLDINQQNEATANPAMYTPGEADPISTAPVAPSTPSSVPSLS